MARRLSTRDQAAIRLRLYRPRHAPCRCDALVLVTGRIPDDALYHELSATLPSRHTERIGDCLAPSHIADAVFSGHRFAREFDEPLTRLRSAGKGQSHDTASIAPTSPPARTPGALQQRPWKQFTLPYRPIEVMSADHAEAIHDTALTILEEIGMKVLEPRARGYYASAGANDRGRRGARAL